MPTLDVSDVLMSPEFCDYVTVTRRAQTVNSFGEVGVTPTVYPNIPVVITTVPPEELRRGEDEQNEPRSFTIISMFRLQGPTVNNQPDIVTYLGDNYIIDWVEPYTRYGAGMIEARMSSIDHSDTLLT